jgi:hypothetical protein
VYARTSEDEEMNYAVNIRYAKECQFVVKTDDELTSEQVWKKLETCDFEKIEDSLAEWELATEYLKVLEMTPTEDEADVRLALHVEGSKNRYDELCLVKDDG